MPPRRGHEPVMAGNRSGREDGISVEFRVLGALEVRDDDRQIDLGTGQQRKLLAILLLRANEVVSTDRLIEDLWDGRPPPTAAGASYGSRRTASDALAPATGARAAAQCHRGTGVSGRAPAWRRPARPLRYTAQ